ncbi:MAG TPA: hypothetical protein PLM79_03165 [Syntrophobacteraceae bacterium]|nr:hypothetical protein [Syntrophobacteraceae bacterium]
MTTQLTDGQKYLLPNGEVVIARHLADGILLEFKRKYRVPLEVGETGALILRGNETAWRVEQLTPVKDD